MYDTRLSTCIYSTVFEFIVATVSSIDTCWIMFYYLSLHDIVVVNYKIQFFLFCHLVAMSTMTLMTYKYGMFYTSYDLIVITTDVAVYWQGSSFKRIPVQKVTEACYHYFKQMKWFILRDIDRVLFNSVGIILKNIDRDLDEGMTHLNNICCSLNRKQTQKTSSFDRRNS